MAAIVPGVQASASVVVNASRSCRSLQQRKPLNVVCSSSQLSCQGVLAGGGVTKVGFSETKNHPQVLYFLKPKQALRLRATGSSEFQAVSREVVAEYATISSVDVASPPVKGPGSEFVDTTGLPIQFEDAPLLGEEGSQASQFSSDTVTGDVPAPNPSVDDLPSLPDGIDFTPSTSPPGVDAFQSAAEDGSAGEAVLSAEERYLRLTQGRGQSTEQLQTDDNGGAINAAQDSINAARDSINSARNAAVNSVEGVVNTVRDTVDSAGNTVKNAVRDTMDSASNTVKNAFRDTLDSAGNTVKNAYESVTGPVVKVVKSGTGTYDKSVDDVQGAPVDFTSVFRVGTPANDALKEIVTAVKSATSSTLAGAGDLISQGYTTTKGIVPEDVKGFLDTVEGKVSQISGPVGSVIDQALVIITDAERALGLDPDNPVIPVIVAVGGSLVIGFGYFNSRYGGYSGDLLPSAALDLLKNEKNAVLVDIRSQEAREAEGIPDIRRSTRSKVAVVEVAKMEGPLRSMVKNVSEVEVFLTTAVIRNLKNVETSSKIIVLDTDGGQSKQIARGLRKCGVRSTYLVDGGFKAWASSGLRCKAEGPQNPLLVLQEDAAAIVEEVKPTRLGVFAVLLGFAAGTYAVIEWEKALQFIGLLGLTKTIYSRLESYESVEDAKADLRRLLRPFNLVSQGIVWIAGIVEPKKLQLATSPASSIVQGRVIQAAAKHGPGSSELELVQDESNTTQAVEENDGGDETDGGDRVGGGDDSSKSPHTSLQEQQ